MTTLTKLQRTEQKIARAERELARTKLKERKAETRRKIEWGGLVVKAKMSAYPKAIILGALLDALENLQNDPAAKNLYQAKGEAAFLDHKEI